MMQSLLIVSLLFSFSLGARESLLNDLVRTGKEMIALINEAKDCEVEFDQKKGRLQFCTGLTLEQSDLKFFKELSLKECKRNLKKAGNRVVEAKQSKKPKFVSDEIWQDFFSTTKLALIVYDEKLILFKSEAKRGDCLHETLHYYQRQRLNQKLLSPRLRKRKQQALQALLERGIVQVETLEKSGKISEAQTFAKKMQPFIALQKEWMNIGQWLDEKEIYQAFLDHYKLFSLGERDYDIALANLLKLKESLSWRLKERVIELGNTALTEKYAKVPFPTEKEALKLKSERFYQDQFNSGRISREEYEYKVIQIRKFGAQISYKTAKKLSQKLNALGRMRKFTRIALPKANTTLTLKLIRKNGFLTTKLDGVDVVIDFGAQKSVLPDSITAKLGVKDVSLVGNQILKTLSGVGKSTPYIQIKKGLSLGGMKNISGLIGTMGGIRLKGVNGILGLDFFRLYNKGAWSLDLDKLVLTHSKSTQYDLSLVKGGRANFDALEYLCHSKMAVKVRIDSGSQVFGDVNPLSKGRAKKCFGDSERFGVIGANSLVFSRRVDVNLGLPFLLEKVKRLNFDLQRGKMSILWRKK